MVTPTFPLEACVGLMKPDVVVLLLTVFNGGLAVPTELPLDEDLEAGILETGFGTGLGVGFTGAGGTRFTVETEVELFKELLELLSDALDVDLSTLKELAPFWDDAFGGLWASEEVSSSLW